jgi:squalene synthase HpnC
VLAPRDYVRSPEALARQYTAADAEAYTLWLATHLHQDFYNVYAYCRWADDLGDEIGDRAESLRLLAWWRTQLDAMYAGEASHPVFVALRGTVARYTIPKELFADLIHAFEQDQIVTRYRTWEDLYRYCRYSANPVGRLVLYLCGYSDGGRQALSDATCTALQLANFWQDVTVDLEKDRVYIPLEILDRHGYTLEDLQARRMTPAFREVMREIVARAREFFIEGLPLSSMVDRRLALDIDLFSRGGLRVLDKIVEQNYDVLSRRPAITKIERIQLLLGSLVRVGFSRAA